MMVRPNPLLSQPEAHRFSSVISNPMDFQTMLKKVKQRQYKSKKEFRDDLDLIWSNCFTYNASEVRDEGPLFDADS
jgi:transcriptional activator SPT7